uniref:ZZ type zinc finger protein n=1 Tax=Marseillevirus LCMAC103 TaxID=2506604 RepID=A0A481YV64_9VIRU|nr:MAG: ZZ type zinc finger protein [Marseillevirus LCMAC103]
MFTVARMSDEYETALLWAYTTLEGAIKRIMFEKLDGNLVRGARSYACDVCDGEFDVENPASYRLGYKCLRCYDWDVCCSCFAENKMPHQHDTSTGGYLGVYDAATKQDDESLAALLHTGRLRENSGAWWADKTPVDESPFWHEKAERAEREQENQPERDYNDFAQRFPLNYKFAAEWVPKQEWFAKLNLNKTIADLVNVDFS